MEVVDECGDLFGWSGDGGGTLDSEAARLGEREKNDCSYSQNKDEAYRFEHSVSWE
jgi:hypothetical protein